MPGEYITNPKEVERKIKSWKEDGPSQLHVVADFDKTLTRLFPSGKKVPSTYALLREGKYLTEDYASRAYQAFDKYHPYEIDPHLSMKEKCARMQEWWQVHWELMVECGMDKETIKDLIKKQKLQLREGGIDFFKFLAAERIPLLIFSSGIGDIIKEFLEDKKLSTPNVHLVANFFEFDQKGKTVGYQKPLIHVFNKNETEIKGTPYYRAIKDRKNVLLLGDILGDLQMTEGIRHEEILKVGFLNEEKDKLLKSYAEAFDVVILDDGPLDYVNELLEKVK